MLQVLGAFYPNGPIPRQIDHHLLSDKTALPEPPLRCVIFLYPGEPEAGQSRFDDTWLLPSLMTNL